MLSVQEPPCLLPNQRDHPCPLTPFEIFARSELTRTFNTAVIFSRLMLCYSSWSARALLAAVEERQAGKSKRPAESRTMEESDHNPRVSNEVAEAMSAQRYGQENKTEVSGKRLPMASFSS